jgi:hypothetical protein
VGGLNRVVDTVTALLSPAPEKSVSGFRSSSFWISLGSFGVIAYLASPTASIAVAVITCSYNLTNAWVKK